MSLSCEKEFKAHYLISSLIYHIGYLRKDFNKLAKEFPELFDSSQKFLKINNDTTELFSGLEKDFRIIADMIEKPPIKIMEGGISWLDCGKNK